MPADTPVAKRLFDGVSTAVLGLCTAAITAIGGVVWNGLHEVRSSQISHGQTLTHIAETIRELKAAAERDRARLEGYMPRTEIDSKLDVLRTTTGEHARRLDRVEQRERRQ